MQNHTGDSRLVQDHISRIERLESCVDKHTAQIERLIGSSEVTNMLIKWVITPLLVILAGLAGVNLVK